ncbi:MAG TPA: hypothetical protein PKC20_00415, partial [Burkholderiaceae bacterium]|nr:hypothetical protein [Burkholderiaceae bacterium]
MHARSIPAAPPGPATAPEWESARRAGARWLADALRASRADTLATFDAYRRVLPDL